jgi:hypothetical protein
MGEGLTRFAEGLLLALREKAQRHHRDMGTHMSREADEIVILQNFLEERVRRAAESDDKPVELGFLGIVYICQYLMADPVRLASQPEQLPEEIHQNGAKLVEFLKTFEDSFEECESLSSVGKARYAWNASKHASGDPIGGAIPTKGRRSA